MAWAPSPGTDIARIVVSSDEKSLIYTLLPEKNLRRFLWLQYRVLESKEARDILQIGDICVMFNVQLTTPPERILMIVGAQGGHALRASTLRW